MESVKTVTGWLMIFLMEAIFQSDIPSIFIHKMTSTKEQHTDQYQGALWVQEERSIWCCSDQQCTYEPCWVWLIALAESIYHILSTVSCIPIWFYPPYWLWVSILHESNMEVGLRLMIRSMYIYCHSSQYQYEPAHKYTACFVCSIHFILAVLVNWHHADQSGSNGPSL